MPGQPMGSAKSVTGNAPRGLPGSKFLWLGNQDSEVFMVTTSYKYKKIKLPDGSTRDEHRLVIENELGRRLHRTECVHHLNGNSLDNRRGNLKLMSLSEHGRLHSHCQVGCSVPGCSNPHRARGLCHKHWKRWRRTGDIYGLRGPRSSNPLCIP